MLALAEDPRFAEVLGCATGFQSEELKAAIKKSRVIYNHGDEYENGFEMSERRGGRAWRSPRRSLWRARVGVCARGRVAGRSHRACGVRAVLCPTGVAL